MASSAKRSTSRATFTHAVRVEVRRLPFHLLESVRQLDVDKMARSASARFEVGYFETGDCRQLVRAVVRRGMVTGLEADPCPGDATEPAPRELARVMTEARRRLGPGGPPVRFPMPVARFVSQAAGLTIKTMVCVQICLFRRCWVCCKVGDQEPICGKSISIDTTP